MGSCFHFELCVRLLAQKHFRGESVSLEIGDKNGKPGLLSLLFQRLEFSDDEKALLPKCNKLRNKIIHCEPDKIVEILQEIEPEFRPANRVKRLSFGKNAAGGEVLEALKTHQGAVNVQDTVSREDGFLGWMIQAAHDGTFQLAASVFIKGIEILNSKLAQS